MIGGGVPKNFAQDTVVCAEILGHDDVEVHKYAVQITVADVRDGACSSSTLQEAASWGKVVDRDGADGVRRGDQRAAAARHRRLAPRRLAQPREAPLRQAVRLSSSAPSASGGTRLAALARSGLRTAHHSSRGPIDAPFRCLFDCRRLFLAAPALADDAPAKDGDKDEDRASADVAGQDRRADRCQVDGRVLRYKATVGHIDIRDDKGKTIGQVVYTAYIVPERRAARPVTFAFNGGPARPSVFLNMGAIGPKQRRRSESQGDSPSDPAVLRDNPRPGSTSPISSSSTRRHRLLAQPGDADETKKDFYDAKTDIEYLSRVVYDWLIKNGRMTSRKYLVGESYGGFRVPRLAYYLQSQMGVGVSGLVMVSPYLDPPAIGNETAFRRCRG